MVDVLWLGKVPRLKTTRELKHFLVWLSCKNTAGTSRFHSLSPRFLLVGN